MTIAINVKGYVNWNDRWWNNVSNLLTYAELIALNDDVLILTELNTDPEWYYNSLNDSWNMIAGAECQSCYLLSSNGSVIRINNHRFNYDSWTWTSWTQPLAPI